MTISDASRAQSRARRDDRREAILDRLIDLFCAEGFRHLGLDEMARHGRCSKSSLYELGTSKDQITTAVVRAFFRRATERIEARVDGARPADAQIRQYLELIAAELAPASPAFYEDLDAFAPAREVYEQNTRIAADHVHALVLDAIGPRSRLDAEFVGAVAGLVMEAIHRRDLERLTGLDAGAAYRALSNLISAGIRP
jgi:AcrR family transcriptional regulator